MTLPATGTHVVETGATVVLTVHAAVGGRGRKRLKAGDASAVPARSPATPRGRIPRVARVLALAHHWQFLIGSGVVRDQADLARLVGVSRARVTQVMDLLRLAPDIQEAVLDLPRVERGRDPIHGRDLCRLAAEPLWGKQRRIWSSTRPLLRVRLAPAATTLECAARSQRPLLS